MFKFKIFCGVAYLVHLLHWSVAVEVYTPCNKNDTPQNATGVCISLTEVELRKCPPLKKLLKEKNWAALEATFCTPPNSPDEVPWVQVCCPLAEYKANPGPDPEELRNHKNFNLLDHSSCGQATVSDRIIGGNDVPPGEQPWMARLAFKTRGGGDRIDYTCGGTIISSRYILTAAHCFKTKGTVLAHVRIAETNEDIEEECVIDAGDLKLCMEAQDYEYEEVIIHPEYKGTGKPHDIALIRLSKEISNFSTPFVQPICLPIKQNLPTIYTNAQTIRLITVLGWGKLKNSAASGSAVLQQLKVQVQDTHHCNNIYRVVTNTTISDSQICAGGEKDKGSCLGDSGGPLILKEKQNYYQIGIVSFGQTKCAAEHIPVVYTSVSKYLEWILDNIKP